MMNGLKGKRMLMLTDGNFDNASARIRAIQYIPFFETQGYHLFHIPRIPKVSASLIGKYTVFPVFKQFYFIKMVCALLFVKWDVVFIQRIFIKKNFLKLLNNRATPIIYDFDDAIYIHPKHPENRKKTADMIRHATKVIVSTNFLFEFCRQNGKEAELIPSPVETERITPVTKSADQVVTIGWIGSFWTTGFLEQIEKPLQKLAGKYAFRFLSVGARPEFKLLNINHIAKPWIFEDENNVIGSMDIGIMPLPDTEYTRMKGGYKILQYFSAGIPCVASPVGINQSIIKEGETGFLASSDEEWYLALEKLINDFELRTRLGSNGRKEAIELYSRGVCFDKLIKIIQKI